ncbi:cobalt transporter CbiM [Sulfurospirillum oryzae]|uniref:cobalt transporter CbiM n=1 Tax=Sulfurospirillum oryzae TaxID=2976535 RepID=UPI0021E9194C|nr:cobalt transporter CbiM [Sulfurospirillum oryzae]
MHIPDGYLSPLTCIATYAAALPLWVIAFKKLKSQLDETTLPLIASLSALSFIIMMFNIPIPGGTSGHAVGASLIAILFGPWVASLCVSLVLLIQALIFGDGGVTTFGANALLMAFAASFSSYYVFEALKTRTFAPYVSGWVGVVCASIVLTLFLGIQPIIAVADGQPLYFPFGFALTFPAVVGSHMLFFGVVEAIFTGIAYRYIVKNRIYKGANV